MGQEQDAVEEEGSRGGNSVSAKAARSEKLANDVGERRLRRSGEGDNQEVGSLPSIPVQWIGSSSLQKKKRIPLRRAGRSVDFERSASAGDELATDNG